LGLGLSTISAGLLRFLALPCLLRNDVWTKQKG